MDSPAIVQRQQTPLVNIQQASYTGTTLFPATKPTLSQPITAEIPITTEVLQTLKKLNKIK